MIPAKQGGSILKEIYFKGACCTQCTRLSRNHVAFHLSSPLLGERAREAQDQEEMEEEEEEEEEEDEEGFLAIFRQCLGIF